MQFTPSAQRRPRSYFQIPWCQLEVLLAVGNLTVFQASSLWQTIVPSPFHTRLQPAFLQTHLAPSYLISRLSCDCDWLTGHSSIACQNRQCLPKFDIFKVRFSTTENRDNQCIERRKKAILPQRATYQRDSQCTKGSA